VAARVRNDHRVDERQGKKKRDSTPEQAVPKCGRGAAPSARKVSDDLGRKVAGGGSMKEEFVGAGAVLDFMVRANPVPACRFQGIAKKPGDQQKPTNGESTQPTSGEHRLKEKTRAAV